jgi:hypothetical protein
MSCHSSLQSFSLQLQLQSVSLTAVLHPRSLLLHTQSSITDMLYHVTLAGSDTPTDLQTSQGSQPETCRQATYMCTPDNTTTTHFHEGTPASDLPSGSKSSPQPTNDYFSITRSATRPPEEETNVVTLPQTPRGDPTLTHVRIEQDSALQDPIFVQVRQKADAIYHLEPDRDSRREWLSQLVTNGNKAASQRRESDRRSGKLRPGSKIIQFRIHEGTGTDAEWALEPGHTRSFISPHCMPMENAFFSKDPQSNAVHQLLAWGTLAPRMIGDRVEYRVQGRRERQRDYDIEKAEDESLKMSEEEQKDLVNFWELDNKKRAVLVRPCAADDDTVTLL